MALLSVVTGCVALPAIPVAIGSALYVRNQARIRAATPVPAAPSAESSARVQTPLGGGASTTSRVEQTTLTELPRPSAPASLVPGTRSEEWQRFFGYALGQSAQLSTADPAESALLAPFTSLEEPGRRACSSRRPAVIIDLDTQERPFAPEQLGAASRDLAAGLAQLRDAGIIILWIGQVPAARAADAANALRASGLDPQSQDQLLLIRNGEDRKQVLREQANEDVCVVAIAGDRRGDFDELFDYLRNPAGAVALYPMMGNGWFLVPPLVDTPGATAE